MELLGVVLLLVAAMLLEGWLYSRYGLRHLQYRCYFQQKEVPEGSVLELVEELENQKFLPLPWLKAELTLPKWLEVSGAHTVQTGEVQVLTSIFAVKSYSQVRRTWQVRVNKRGTYSVEHALLMTANLLGNTRQSMRVEDRGNPILVLPIPYEQAAPFGIWGCTDLAAARTAGSVLQRRCTTLSGRRCLESHTLERNRQSTAADGAAGTVHSSSIHSNSTQFAD